MMRQVLRKYINPSFFDAVLGLVSSKYYGRAYHNSEHIDFCLKKLYSLSGITDDEKMILSLAIVFHDVETTETESANLATTLLRSTGSKEVQSPSVIRLIELLILGTIHFKHRELKLDEDELKLVNIMNDIDLSILGQDAEQFSQYDELIVKEYLDPNAKHFLEFTVERLKVLEYFYNLDSIFKTPRFYEELEAKAKVNLEFRINLYRTIIELLNSGFSFVGRPQYINLLNCFVPPSVSPKCLQI